MPWGGAPSAGADGTGQRNTTAFGDNEEAATNKGDGFVLGGARFNATALRTPYALSTKHCAITRVYA